ncbi:DMT family transporter [Thalassomonas viridans]|uniref:DMT family transporter n=1 Tax=Thalassomonas viridans TaxID=137584 RepID=A0AAE9Z6B8_9GAMM|nr:DMT family transporter [Thalassomonas viridans]WDE06083.1 DMT family transporter [Thalassomonas viridans]
MHSAVNNNLQLWLMGLFLALVVLIAKSVINAGVHPIYVAFFQAAGSFLYLVLTGAGRSVRLRVIKEHFTFFMIASLLGFTIPQLIVFSAVNHVGVGIASLSYALPLIVAYLISLKIGLERFNLKSLLFLLLSVAGTVVYLFRSEYFLDFEGSKIWFIVLLLSPLSIGVANVYRSVKWPQDIAIPATALLTNAFSSVTYLFLLLAMQVEFNADLWGQDNVAVLLGALMLLSGVGQYLLFALQKNAGPVFIGQTGSIVTLFGGILGYLVYNDAYSYHTFAGSLLIFIGVYYYSKIKWQYAETGH